jgi:hypothetical protein
LALPSREHVLRWAATAPTGKEAWFIIKDAQANGAAGLWLVPGSGEVHEFVQSTRTTGSARYVVQTYITDPMLWNGKKFHFRVLGVLLASGEAYVHRVAFLHPANSSYTTASTDFSVHVTNLCSNFASKHVGEIVGEVIEDLAQTRPNVFAEVMRIWHNVVGVALRPVLQHQRNLCDFEYVGLDFMCTSSGDVALLEANCPPGMVSPTGLLQAEALHDVWIFDTIRAFAIPGTRGPLGGLVLAGLPSTETVVCSSLRDARAKCTVIRNLLTRRKLAAQ